MAEESTDPRMAQAAVFGRRVLAALGWLARLLLGLGWTAIYLLLRLAEVSKRVWPTLAFLAAVCFTVAWVLLALRDFWLWTLLGLLIGVVWAVSSETAWQELRARLEFIADAHPESRLLHADGELRRLMQSGPITWHAFARFALGALFAVLVVTGWQEMSVQLRAMAVSFVMAVSGVIFAAVGIVVTNVERQQEVRFFVKGWRLADPAWLEVAMLARWPKLGPILGWRPAITARLAPLREAALPWLQPWGMCAE